MKIAFSPNAQRVLEARYLRRDAGGEIAETPEELFRRVARSVAAAEGRFPGGMPGGREEEFFAAMASLEFLPNSPTLMNAGAPLGQLSACYVLPVEDSIEEIFDSLKLMARIQQSGGGTGFSFSHLRPRGARVRTAGGVASGPVSFMRIFDCATENIRQGGRRQGANMGVLRADHPDIAEFVDAKRDGRSFRNFNLSVAVTDAFMEERGGGELLARIAAAAWETGDPGLLFLDAIARGNPTPELGAIEATNPCGEVPLLPYEACNLGSVNLARMLRAGSGGGEELDWEKLARTARLAARFLDDVIEVNRWPDPRIESRSRGNRKIGLGVMGLAETLLRLGVPYASDAAAALAERIAEALDRESLAESEELARERGPFPNWPSSPRSASSSPRRNATRVSIAPTGSISILADTSASIEPLFALAYRRRALDGQTLVELNAVLSDHVRRLRLDAEPLLSGVAATGSLPASRDIPEETRELFQTALQIPPDRHLAIQRAFQAHTDNAVSKTVNLPASASPDEIAKVYRRAFELELKGITIYRYGSKEDQTLTLGADDTPEAHEHFARCDPRACRL